MVRMVLALAVWATASLAQVEVHDAAAMSRAALEVLIEEGGAPGIQVAVWQEGELVWSEGLGHADLELDALVTTTTKFRVASISKAMTGTLLATMAAEGVVDPDAPVSSYLPDYPEVGAAITARQLASHTSGIRHYQGNEISQVVTYPSLHAALAIFASDDLLFAPGEGYDYSTYGFTLLGAMLEAAGEGTFFELLDERVLRPLGMTHTVVDARMAIIPERARSYELVGGRVINARPTDHSYKIPGGGMLSTAEDLVKLGAATIEPGVLEAAVIELLHTRTRLNSGRATGYSLGWRVNVDDDGPTRISHTGSQPGSTCALLVRPRERIVVAVLCNARRAPVGLSTAEMVARHFDRELQTTDVDPVGEFEFETDQGEVHVEIERATSGLIGMLEMGGRRVALSRVVASGDRVAAYGFDDRLIEVVMTVDGDEAEAVIRGEALVEGRGRRTAETDNVRAGETPAPPGARRE